ncbi:glycosyltransferase family 4 protein [Idiomarina sp. Sol25]|uniref:glycosyltransferase family 4 protein n=1 Tax=Idiomarina sp. Sol25 TaxID=3064000 RepID=UPI00294AA75F|nr:glycosyltransferase family 4 protein [Idiomarina sp. Sol25]MDV6328054.1 glycosyltransferase family 4 protein [Idiomarina sp. Sol25]
MKKKLLFIVNCPDFFLSHRAPLAEAAKLNGYSVHVATGKGKGVEKIVRNGFTHHEVPFSRSGQNPVTELKTLYHLFSLLRKVKPNLIHLVTIKPVLYGGLVNRLSNNIPLVAAVSGLGTVFTSSSVFGRLRRFLIKKLYSFALGCRSVKVIFQNPDDKSALLNSGVVSEENTSMIRGSGVDLEEYGALPEPEGKRVQVVMAARLLVEKGVYEFYKAAELLESRDVSVEMKLIGTPDPGNPKSLSELEFESWKEKSFIEILGFRSDIAEQYANANIVCLPSYYGEGLPKSLIEAAACGRAIITTDSPGCNYAIENGITGVLIPPKDYVALADVIEELVKNTEKRQQMGKAGRAFAEKHFDINVVVKHHLDIYQELLNND